MCLPIVMYVLETVLSFRACLTGCKKKVEVVIPPYWVQLDYVVVIHEYLLKQTEHLALRVFFSHDNLPKLRRVDEFCIEPKNIYTQLNHEEQFFISNDIAHDTQRQNAQHICSFLSEKRRTEFWKIYVHLKTDWKTFWGNKAYVTRAFQAKTPRNYRKFPVLKSQTREGLARF